jgi:hypothetical protein
MGYATVQNVPRVTDYEVAKYTHDTSKPIRGRDVRPLGARRDHELYSVQMDGDNVQFICYRTPVVTYHPDNTITLNTDGWASVSTHQFIQKVLGIQANGHRGSTALTIDGKRYLVDRTTHTFRLKPEGGNWHILSEVEGFTTYRINRKAANNVRAKFKPFIQYLKGFSKVRAETITPKYGQPHQAIRFSYDELKAAFGLNDTYEGHANWQGTNTLFQKQVLNHASACEEMLALVTSEDHEKWHKAALWMFGHNNHMIIV